MMFNSVVKEICFKYLQDVIATSVRDVAAPLYHNQPCSQHSFSLGTRLPHNGKENFYRVFLQKVEAEMSKWQFCLSARPSTPILSIIIDGNKTILWWWPSDAFCGLLQFVQFKKTWEKKLMGECCFTAILLKLAHLHEGFSCFLNFADGTKSRKAAHLFNVC